LPKGRRMAANPSPVQDQATVTVLDPLTAEIIDALRYFRGVCHRKQVIEYIQAAHLRAGDANPALLAEAILAAFDRQLGDGADDPRPFRLPFGPGSHRWAISEMVLRA
jgi:hypothetical protein